MLDIIILLRGYIFNSFKDAELCNFVKKLCDQYNITIYIHTWNRYSIDGEFTRKSDILNYFSEIKDVIKSITIDHDKNFDLIGDDAGNIFSTRISKISWKRMWYGIYKTALKIKNEEPSSKQPLVINMRFDLFNNYNLFINEKELLEFIKINVDRNLYKNLFLRDSKNLIDIDNFYVGSIESMYNLSYNFHNNLDYIDSLYSKIYYQEAVVYYENNRLFDNKSRNNDNIELYIIHNPDDIELSYDNMVNDEKNRFNIFYTNNLRMQRKEDVLGKPFHLTQLTVKDQPFMKVKPVPGTNWRGFGKK